MPWMLSVHAGSIHRDLQRLHSVWGPVVRITPNELSFVDAQAFQDIYGRRKGGLYPFPKDPSFSCKGSKWYALRVYCSR